jgi:bile acid-coenzyme A ligase
MAPTPILLRLARHDGLRRDDLVSVEWIQHGGSPLPEWIAHFWIDLVGGDRFFTSYGSAESLGIVACRGDEWLAHPGTLGRGQVGTEVIVCDDEGRPVPDGDIGLLYLRRPDGPLGTYAGRGAPGMDLRPDGFGTVGDLGWIGVDGYVFLADRRVDLIVSGGANVYPAEVEAAISEDPRIGDVVVIGLPDPQWGHRVHAIVEPAPGGTLSADVVRVIARSRLAPYKVPKTVELVDKIPRSEAMKVNRRRLVDERSSAADSP